MEFSEISPYEVYETVKGFVRDFQFYDMPVSVWLGFILCVLLLSVVLNKISGYLVSKAQSLSQKSSNRIDDTIVTLLSSVSPLFIIIISIYISSIFIPVSGSVGNKIETLLVFGFIVQGALSLTQLFKLSLQRFLSLQPARSSIHSARGLLTITGRVLIWSTAFLLVLSNLGVNISALLAGLGVGGIAVALAVQTILGDVIASLSIILDRPFEVGDFIIVDSVMGVVEHIGVKTTRIRSLSGEQLVLSNSDLIASRIRNYKRMAERRVVLQFGFTYQTRPEHLRALPGYFEEIIKSQENVRFDRAHFAEYGDFALKFEVVFYVLSADYNEFMDIKQNINLQVFEKCDSEGIEFAYPTQTLFLDRAQKTHN